MAERKAGEEPGSQAPAHEDLCALPSVGAPPLSPAGELAAAPVLPLAGVEVGTPVRLKLTPRHKRRARALAAVALAASFGALIGSLASSWGLPAPNVAGLEERQAMQRSIAHLSKQVALLKAKLEKAAAHAQLAERRDGAPEITGSIRKAGEEIPLPRPAPHLTAAASRPAVVPDWSIRDVRDGYVYVQTNGDIYQVVPGAPLPGLGPVQSITRRGDHWVVVTPRGIIVSARDRRFFD
jgi:hypothetical protein